MDDPQKKLFIRNLVIASCLGLLGAFLTAVSVVTILLATNFNVLNWME